MALSAPPTNGAPVVATLSLISRLGWKRAGTRFNTRGIDDDGNTANFVEARLLIHPRFTRSHILSRQKQYFQQISIVSVTFKCVGASPVGVSVTFSTL